MTTTPTLTTMSQPLPLAGVDETRPPNRRGHLGLIVTAALGLSAAAAVGLPVTVFAGAREPVTTGVALQAFAAGWLLLATLATRFTEHPQRWAFVPAAATGVPGAGLLVFTPGDAAMDVLGWIWPPAMLALGVWIAVTARRHLRSRVRGWVVYPVAAVMALAAVGAGIQTVLDKAPAMPAAGRMVDVGNHRLYLECAGTGSPTVVLSNGFTEHTPSWAWVTPTISQASRVCVYDRAGQGWSDPAKNPQDGNQVADDLHSLLINAGITGPYLLAGHSSGGIYNLIFAARYPAEVTGMVLLDSATPEQFTALPAYPSAYDASRRISTLYPPLARLGIGRITLGLGFTDLPPAARNQEQAFASSARQMNGQRDEWSKLPVAFDQAKALHDLGIMPLIVVTADLDTQQGWDAAQHRLAELSANGVQRTVTGSTHEALLHDPTFAAFSNAAILDVLRAARTGTAVAS